MELKGFCITAIKDIKAGEHLYISYTIISNTFFFLNYGFIQQVNPANAASIAFQLENDENDPLTHVKYRLLGC